MAWIKANRANLLVNYPDLNIGEITALTYYTKIGDQINYWLRQQAGEPVSVLPGIEWSDEHAEVYKSFLDSGLDLLPLVDSSITPTGYIYRGLGDEESQNIKNLTLGDLFTRPNYYSTTTDVDVAEDFAFNKGGDVILLVTTSYSKGRDISPFAQEDEDEVLHKRNSTFRKMSPGTTIGGFIYIVVDQ